jgi:hypothetical protein
MYDLNLAVIVITVAVATLAAVYLWSKNADRRIRAWQLLKLLLRR